MTKSVVKGIRCPGCGCPKSFIYSNSPRHKCTRCGREYVLEAPPGGPK